MFNFIEKIKKIQVDFFSSFDVCFDFGTSYTRIAIKDRGIILREPTIIGYNNNNKSYVFYGQEAKKIVGKAPNFINIIRPINHGIITNFDAQLALIEYFLKISIDHYLNQYKLLKPILSACVAVPSISTEIEKKAVEELLNKLNFRHVFLIEKPVANLAGLGFNPLFHQPTMIVDLGAGLFEAAIVSGGGVINQKTSKQAGNQLNEKLNNYIYLKHGLIIGENIIEEVKEKLLSFDDEEKYMTIRGKSLENGLPKSIRLKTPEIKEALAPSIFNIIDLIKELIEISPPEVIDEVYKNGIFLSGGLAKIPRLGEFITKEIKINIKTIDNPDDMTIKGLIKIINNKDILEKISLTNI